MRTPTLSFQVWTYENIMDKIDKDNTFCFLFYKLQLRLEGFWSKNNNNNSTTNLQLVEQFLLFIFIERIILEHLFVLYVIMYEENVLNI